MTNQIVEPSHADSIAADASGSIGGPIGSFRSKNNWWNPIRVLIALSASVYAIGYVLDLSCRNSGWVSPENYEHLCYSDIPPLFSLRGFADGLFLYAGGGDDHSGYHGHRAEYAREHCLLRR